MAIAGLCQESILFKKYSSLILISIDVTKHNHDCFSMNSDGEILIKAFTFPKNSKNKTKVRFKTTKHYSYDAVIFTLNKIPTTFVINSLYTSLFCENIHFRNTKTNKVDSKTIVTMLMYDVGLRSYSNTYYNNEEL